MKLLKKVLAIVGARPQFIKHYPFEVAAKDNFEVIGVHTGQHYDENMSKVFFDQLGMKKPDYQLNLGGGSHGAQTGKMLIEIEKIVLDQQPSAMVVYGDTNSTLAGALVASKLGIPIVHIEAGLRSYNKSMPEEINRVMTDHVSDLLLIPSEASKENLNKEGITQGVHIVGDIMKDILSISREKGMLKNPNIKEPYYYATLHRPYNVDKKERLTYILKTLSKLDKKVIFSIHPRTRINLEKYGLIDFIENSRIILIDPQPYFENLGYLLHSEGLITDSGGMQKEAYWLEKKCVTIRSETEWIETLNDNCNTLVFENIENINSIFNDDFVQFDEHLYGDGKASNKIVSLINKLIE